MFSTVSLNMLVTVAMLIQCICFIWDSGAGGELSASRMDIPQGDAYFQHVFNTCKMSSSSWMYCIVVFVCIIHMFSIVLEHLEYF